MSDKDHNSGGHGHGEGEEKKHSHKKHHHAAHPEHEHEEGWIVSFADNVLLMMGFFVILLAMNMGPKGESDAAPSQTPQERLLDVAIAVRDAFNNPLSMNSTAPADQPLIRHMRNRQTKGDVKGPGPDGESNSVQTVRPSDYAGAGGFVRFAENGAELDADGRRTVAQISEEIAGSRWIIEIRGHASRFETWGDVRKAHELAHKRAWAVGAELVEQGMKWEQMRLVSVGDAAPVEARARSADEGRTNQRAEILVLTESAPADPYSDNAAPSDGGH